MTVRDYGGPKKREAEADIIDNWPQQTEFRSWKISFKSEVSRSSQYPRAATLWIGEVENAESIDELFSAIGDPIPDFDNLDLKNASGVRKILPGNFKNKSPHPKAKQSEKRSPTGKQILWWMVCDFFKISCDNEAFLDFTDLSKVQFKSDNVQAWDKVYQT